MLILGPNFFSQYWPGCPNQPRIDFSYYKYVPRLICLLICDTQVSTRGCSNLAWRNLVSLAVFFSTTWCLVNEQNHPLHEILIFLQKMIRLKNFKWDDQNNLRCNFAKIQSFSCEKLHCDSTLDLLLSFSTIPFIFPGYLNLLVRSNTMIGKF